MVFNRVTEKETEVDVLVEATGAEEYRCAFECRDHKRRAGPEWIDHLCGKREQCGLDRVVAVHSRGFTASAIKLAQAQGVATLTVDELRKDTPTRHTAIDILRAVADTPRPLISEVRLVAAQDVGLAQVSAHTQIMDTETGGHITLEVFARLVLEKCPPPETAEGGRRCGRFKLPPGRYVATVGNQSVECAAVEIAVSFASGHCSPVQRLLDLESNAARQVFAQSTIITQVGELEAFAGHDLETGKDLIMIAGPHSREPYVIAGTLQVTTVDPKTGKQTEHIVEGVAGTRRLSISILDITLELVDSGGVRREPGHLDDTVLQNGARGRLDDLLVGEIHKGISMHAWFRGPHDREKRRGAFSVPDLYIDRGGEWVSVSSIEVSWAISAGRPAEEEQDCGEGEC
jgi:hypothetical protein